MGWWSIDKSDTLVTGDGPLDVMGEAVFEIIQLYIAEWNCKPTKRELQRTLEYCMGPWKLKDGEDDGRDIQASD